MYKVSYMNKTVKLKKLAEDQLMEGSENIITVYHGTRTKFVNDIKRNGLEDRHSNPYQQGWYMVSTDFESALFHATPSDESKDFVYVFEFKVPIDDGRKWHGYPYLWKGEVRDGKSTWFALMKKIPKKFITKVHKVPYQEWLSQKQKGF